MPLVVWYLFVYDSHPIIITQFELNDKDNHSKITFCAKFVLDDNNQSEVIEFISVLSAEIQYEFLFYNNDNYVK